MASESKPDRRDETLRVAIRRYGPFETAIEKQWANFQKLTGCPLRLEWESLDLNPSFALAHAGMGYAMACGGQPESGPPRLDLLRAGPVPASRSRISAIAGGVA